MNKTLTFIKMESYYNNIFAHEKSNFIILLTRILFYLNILYIYLIKYSFVMVFIQFISYGIGLKKIILGHMVT